MKILVWRVFQCMEIVEGEELKLFFLIFVYNLIITSSNTQVCHQPMCVM